MLDHLFLYGLSAVVRAVARVSCLELVLGLEAGGRLEGHQLCNKAVNAITYKLPPCFSHVLRNAALHGLDLTGTKTGHFRNRQMAAEGIVGSSPRLPVLLCFGLVKPGPTGPCRVWIGAWVLILRSRGALSTAAVAMVGVCEAQRHEIRVAQRTEECSR